MFEALRPMLTKLDLLGGRWYQSANDGFDGNNSATEAMGFQNNRYVGDNAMSAATNDEVTDTPVFI
ncbi:hypothetical protein T484DRAFT_1955134 [Baffinella frigidus]|nr:hypothetical protein T484DRAFT_1955134 [Cryptophyta sp. CCMP2293]